MDPVRRYARKLAMELRQLRGELGFGVVTEYANLCCDGIEWHRVDSYL
jgi:hypothetical protein